jgi:hypothetical protein
LLRAIVISLTTLTKFSDSDGRIQADDAT